MKIVFVDQLDVEEDFKDKLSKFADVVYYDDILQDEGEIIKRLVDAEIVVVNWIDVTANIILNSPNLKYIITSSVGYEWIDTETATKKGIKVLNCPTFNTPAVAEHTIALMFAISKNIVRSNIDLKNGVWDKTLYLNTELSGKTLGIIGMGTIGIQVAEKARVLGMTVIGVNSKSSDDELNELLSDSDIVSLHIPANKQNEKFMDKEKLSKMKPTAYLINTSRGAVVYEDEIINVLDSGKLAGYATDVFADEPKRATAKSHDLKIVDHPKIVATTHIAFKTVETKMRLSDELFANIESCVNNDPINVVNV